mmetsp:Transcript_19441/g.58199  ORF Transcript_19441/g.58199 Transcript_19441/m.58199 type:complete len:269 (+) Transcript_19441:568-1374(+)
MPFLAYPTELDCVYLIAIMPTIMSNCACSETSLLAVTTFFKHWASQSLSFRRCIKPKPPAMRYSMSGGWKFLSACKMMNLPPFLFFRISRASGSKPGAIIPSLTSAFKILAVASSMVSETATKSPKEHIGSALRARTYAAATGVSSLSATAYTVFSSSESSTPMAAPAGLTCLNDAAAGLPVAWASSRTSCHAFTASSRLMYPGVPHMTSKGSLLPPTEHRPAGSWCGLHPYFKGRSMWKATVLVAGGSSTCPAIHWLTDESYAEVSA